MKLFLGIICFLLGTGISIWTTWLQSTFLETIGISPWGAITIEPLLIVVSFLLGIKISRGHSTLSIIFMIILSAVSFLTILSMFTSKSYNDIIQQEINSSRIESSQKNEDIIRDTLDSLKDRGVGSKSAIAIIDRLQKQETTIIKKAEISEVSVVIDIISKFIGISKDKAIFVFTILISLTTVFAPPFLFFSSGLILSQAAFLKRIYHDKIAKLHTLTASQKSVYLAYENVTKDVEELAKFLNMKPGIVNMQLTKISKKLKAKDFYKPIEVPKKKVEASSRRGSFKWRG